MLNVTYKPFMLNIVMLSVIMLNVTYKPIMLNDVMLSVIMLNVIILSVVAPNKKPVLLIQLMFKVVTSTKEFIISNRMENRVTRLGDF
jgi:hypothetical protein